MTSSRIGTAVEARARPSLAIVLPLATAAFVFRIAAWLNPSRLVDIPDSLATPTSALGVLFLVCAIWVWRSRSPLAPVFLIYGIGGCVHWGGTIASENAALAIAFAVLYVAGTAAGDAAFLDLALRYPRGAPRPAAQTVAIYLLAIGAFLAVPIAPFLASDVANSLLAVVLLGSLVIAGAGGVVFLVKWFRASADDRRQQSLTAIAIVLIVTNVISLLADGGALPGDPAAWNLVFAIEPVVLAWAVTRLHRPSRA